MKEGETKQKTCEIHGDYLARSIVFSHDIGADGSRVMWTGCPMCDEIHDAEVIERRAAIAERQAEAKLKRQNIEPMYSASTLDNLEPLTDAHTRATKYARSMVADRCGKLVLLGNHGTGKTHLAVSIVRELDGAIYTMYEIGSRIRASYVSGARETELQIVGELARLPMLAIDEIGRTKGSEAETNWISYIIDKRHTRRLPLVLISNRHLRRDCKNGGCARCLENYIAEDVMSRLAEDGRMVVFDGDDYRRKKRLQKEQK